MSAFRQGTVMLAALTATGLLLSGCAVGMSAGANVSVTDRPPHGKEHEQVRDPYQSASMIAAESAVAVSHPH